MPELLSSRDDSFDRVGGPEEVRHASNSEESALGMGEYTWGKDTGMEIHGVRAKPLSDFQMTITCDHEGPSSVRKLSLSAKRVE